MKSRLFYKIKLSPFTPGFVMAWIILDQDLGLLNEIAGT